MIEELIARSGADHVELLAERQELLRFGASRITYQHSEEKGEGRARRGSLWVTLGKADGDALREKLGDAPRGDVNGICGEARVAQTAYATTEEATAEDRVELYRRYSRGVPALGG